MNKNYMRGARFERSVIEYLEKFGFKTLRTAGSHGFTDVIAVGKNVVRFIQCKVTKSQKISFAAYADDIEKIINTPSPENTTRELWIKQDRKEPYKILIL